MNKKKTQAIKQLMVKITFEDGKKAPRAIEI